ncbi:hypothetical protein [Streptomyces sp. AM 3-1-1]|uniref:hypothetical protein n=1 Tax=unclassified Streptomyces TaxID=2593676 RepID=UPI0023B96D6F|nr:hypothetical protein [Streptomyces sp. AM 3-1-1]WEH29502.1 hypothetical protein P0D76_20470 [Streptomyces sp. AM 3-1-1]
MKSLYPYPQLVGDVRLRPARVLLDNLPVELARISDQENVVALHGIDRRWRTARLVMEATADPKEIADGPWRNVRCLMIVTNSRTHVRHSFLTKNEAPGLWRADVDLDRAAHIGHCQVDAVFAADLDDGPARLVGRAEAPWRVDFDSARPTRKRTLKMVWKDFTETPALEEFRDDPWTVDAEAGEPVLYLNSSLEGFRALMEKASGAEQRTVRQLLASHIAAQAWEALFHTALYACGTERDEDGRPQWPGGWHEEVLRSMLPELWPDLSPDDALREAVERRREGGNGADLHARLLHAVATRTRTQKTVTETVRALRRTNDRGAR